MGPKFSLIAAWMFSHQSDSVFVAVTRLHALESKTGRLAIGYATHSKKSQNETLSCALIFIPAHDKVSANHQ
jgi:hypothetical protein